MTETSARVLNERSAAAYASALRTLPGVSSARSVTDTSTNITQIRMVFDRGMDVVLTTAEDCVDVIDDLTA